MIVTVTIDDTIVPRIAAALSNYFPSIVALNNSDLARQVIIQHFSDLLANFEGTQTLNNVQQQQQQQYQAAYTKAKTDIQNLVK